MANIGTAFLELTQMQIDSDRRSVEAPKAQKWDQITWARWLDNNTLSKPARQLLSLPSPVCTPPRRRLSLLFVLFQMASAGGPSFVLGVKDAAEDERPSAVWVRSIARSRIARR